MDRSGSSSSSFGAASARVVAARALGDVATAFSRWHRDVGPGVAGVDFEAVAGAGELVGAERGLALAIQRAGVQRWLTLEFLLSRHLRKPLDRMEPALRGVLVAGAAQLVCFDRLPVHAIVDESVESARKLVRSGAKKLVNAVLRRVADDIRQRRLAEPWAPAPDRLPLDDGVVVLDGELLPAVANLARHLAIATSCPRKLVRQWLDEFGVEATIEMCRHGVATPPTVVAVEDGLSEQDIDAEPCRRHELPGYLVWEGGHERLTQFLAGDPQRRVQDPGSAQPIGATAELRPRRIIDYCAGRGTKTRQVAVLHPQAEVIATDVDAARLGALTTAMAALANVTVLPAEDVRRQLHSADLLILDVPCTNTGALGRRAEARYRLGGRQVGSLVGLQRRIIEHALPLACPGGWVLYSTCSVDPRENQEQAAWLAQGSAGTLESELLLLPKGRDIAYHDGSYRALIRLP